MRSRAGGLAEQIQVGFGGLESAQVVDGVEIGQAAPHSANIFRTFLEAVVRHFCLLSPLCRETLVLRRGRILPFDAAASEAYAALRAGARAQGKAIAPADGYIAATGNSHGLIDATRNTGPFEAASLTVINPWNTQH